MLQELSDQELEMVTGAVDVNVNVNNVTNVKVNLTTINNVVAVNGNAPNVAIKNTVDQFIH
jgi:hypothetical protein